MRRTAASSSKATKSKLPYVDAFVRHVVLSRDLSSYESEDGAVLRNIDACRAIAQTVQTSLGPYGRNKIVINHLTIYIRRGGIRPYKYYGLIGHDEWCEEGPFKR